MNQYENRCHNANARARTVTVRADPISVNVLRSTRTTAVGRGKRGGDRECQREAFASSHLRIDPSGYSHDDEPPKKPTYRTPSRTVALWFIQ